MRRALLLGMVAALAGCATAPPVQPPAAIEVDKIVTVRCIKTAPTRPAYQTENLAPTATNIQYGDALAVDWVASRSYERELEIAVAACLAAPLVPTGSGI